MSARLSAQEITWNVSTYNGYNVSCHGASDGWINIVVVGGNAPYLFNWSNGSFSKNQTNLEAGIYTVIVTDADQNTSSAEIELQQPNALEVALLPELREGGYHISENGGSDGVIGTEVNGGVLPYTYLWSNNTTSNKISNEVAGTYSLVLTDMNGCTAGGSATLTQPTALQIVSISSPLQNGYNISCFDAKNGSIDLSVSGGTPPYEFQWSNGAFTEDIGELDPGSYWVIVRDANGAGDAAQIVLTGPAALEASFNVSSYPNGKNVSCYGCSNASISTTVNGGATPYSFQWDNGATTANLTNLGVGSYNLILNDANGCRLEERVELTGPDREDWTMNGNAGTNPATQFIGTTDNKDLVIKTNNSERLRLKASGIVNFPDLAGSGSRTLQVSQNGDMEAGPLIVYDFYTGYCSSLPLTSPFLRTDIDGPYGSKDIINCSQRFGFGVLAPQERIDVKGFGRFTSNAGNSNYLNIGNDGNSKINSIGTGELLINSESTQNVRICTEPNGGEVEVGGKTILASIRDNVGIKTSNPDPLFALDVNGSIKATALTLNGESIANYWTDGGSGNIYSVKRIGINKSSAPNDDLEVGDELTLHGGSVNKWIGFNNYYYGSAGPNKRIKPGFASRINLSTNGTIKFMTADYDGAANSDITFIDALTISNTGNIGIKSNPVSQYSLNVSGVINADELRINGTALSTLFTQWQSNGNDLFYSAGKVGIGTSTPFEPLSVQGSICSYTDNTPYNYGLQCKAGNDYTKALVVERGGATNFLVYGNGTAFARGMWITYDNFPDYVFEKSYNLLSIDSLKNFIQEYGHLPNIPSKSEIEGVHYSVAELQKKTLEKVEELYLYVIQLKEENDKLRKEILAK